MPKRIPEIQENYKELNQKLINKCEQMKTLETLKSDSKVVLI